MSSETTSRRKFLKETLSGVVFLSVAKLLPSEILLANNQDQVPNELLFFSPEKYLIFEAVAERIIVSASAINSPVLLLKSNLANSTGEAGRNLTFHLTCAVLGLFDSIVYGAGGIP
ncbi:MAG: hypothetical protein Q8P51_11115 [Ignavibacteria bacterium]|nr:hypothetical protein [Ignavibacteria bacterium]